MKYIIENWTTEETIRTFNSEEEREKWIRENCTTFDNGTFITGTEVRISCYEEQSENEEEFKETLRIFMEDYNGFDWKNGTVVLVNNNRPKICSDAPVCCVKNKRALVARERKIGIKTERLIKVRRSSRVNSS